VPIYFRGGSTSSICLHRSSPSSPYVDSEPVVAGARIEQCCTLTVARRSEHESGERHPVKRQYNQKVKPRVPPLLESLEELLARLAYPCLYERAWERIRSIQIAGLAAFSAKLMEHKGICGCSKLVGDSCCSLVFGRVSDVRHT